MSTLLITADYEYIAGRLRYGHGELEVDKDQWESMSKDEQLEYFTNNSEVVIDDFDIDDHGDFEEFYVKEI